MSYIPKIPIELWFEYYMVLLIIYFFQSYNPLFEDMQVCPPRDWRNPNVVDMYSGIVKQVCAEFNVPYIDTSDITGVMWDRQADWAHFKDVSGELEALYLLHRIFS